MYILVFDTQYSSYTVIDREIGWLIDWLIAETLLKDIVDCCARMLCCDIILL
mgnify:CR=1 FL=1